MAAIEGVIESIASDISSSTKTLFETMIMLDLKHDNAFFEDDKHIRTDVIGMVASQGNITALLPCFVQNGLP